MDDISKKISKVLDKKVSIALKDIIMVAGNMPDPMQYLSDVMDVCDNKSDFSMSISNIDYKALHNKYTKIRSGKRHDVIKTDIDRNIINPKPKRNAKGCAGCKKRGYNIDSVPLKRGLRRKYDPKEILLSLDYEKLVRVAVVRTKDDFNIILSRFIQTNSLGEKLFLIDLSEDGFLYSDIDDFSLSGENLYYVTSLSDIKCDKILFVFPGHIFDVEKEINMLKDSEDIVVDFAANSVVCNKELVKDFNNNYFKDIFNVQSIVERFNNNYYEIKRPFFVGGMIVKNNIETIANSIDSILDALDILVVLDTGSTDGTIDIIKSYGSKIDLIESDWTDFRQARQTVVERATEYLPDWFFFIDSDEAMTMGFNLDIRDIMKKSYTDVYGFPMLWIYNDDPLQYIASEYHTNLSPYRVRLWRFHSSINYDPARIVHEHLRYPWKPSSVENLTGHISIQHYCYMVNDYESRKQKVKKYEEYTKGAGNGDWYRAAYLYEEYPFEIRDMSLSFKDTFVVQES